MKSLLRYNCALMITAAILFLEGCSMEDPKPGVSDNLSALREIVNIQIPAKSARWEIFGTPEYTGGVPGPTDFVTLIAELTPTEPNWLDSKKEPTGDIYVAPEAARPWLSEPFRRLMEKNKNISADLSSQLTCRKYETSLKKTGKQVNGFACSNADRLLIYLTLSSTQ
jgi:hypothetical protein